MRLSYAIALALFASSANAATFNVSTTPELRDALIAAASNGEDDVINLAPGTYKTTDDGAGTFTYLSAETHNLTIKGANRDVTIVSGDGLHQILNHNYVASEYSSTLTVENITFQDAFSTASGGAIHSNHEKVILQSTKFVNNYSSSYGGALMVYPGEVEIYQSLFLDNSAKSAGGAIRIRGGGIIENSDFERNATEEYTGSMTGGGAIFSASSELFTILNSRFIDNISNSAGGGAINVSYLNVTAIVADNNQAQGSGGAIYTSRGTIENSLITGNRCSGACYGGGIYSNNGVIQNSIIVNNISEVSPDYSERNSGGIYSSGGYILNNVLKGNSSGVGTGSATIVNNIFLDNNDFDVSSIYNGVAKISHNYIDTNKILGISDSSANVFDVVIGFQDEQSGNYRLTKSSELIDAGATNVEGIEVPSSDADGLARLSGGAIDIGPYEFPLTTPTINSFTFTGQSKELSELTFIVDYELAEGRSMLSVAYDYLGNGEYSELNKHTFNKAGNYEVTVKVTDETGEFSTSSIDVVIQELLWIEMTYEQKLAKAIAPEYYDDLMIEIQNDRIEAIEEGKLYVQDNPVEFDLVTVADKDVAVAQATADGIATGKQYVQDNLTEFNLVTVTDKDAAVAQATADGIATGKQYVQDNLAEFNLVTVTDKDAAVAQATSDGITTGKQYVQDNLAEFNLVSIEDMVPNSVEVGDIDAGWHLISTRSEITDLSVFNSAKIIWVYKDGHWLGWSSDQATLEKIQSSDNYQVINTIPANSGIWISK